MIVLPEQGRGLGLGCQRASAAGQLSELSGRHCDISTCIAGRRAEFQRAFWAICGILRRAFHEERERHEGGKGKVFWRERALCVGGEMEKGEKGEGGLADR